MKRAKQAGDRRGIAVDKDHGVPIEPGIRPDPGSLDKRRLRFPPRKAARVEHLLDRIPRHADLRRRQWPAGNVRQFDPRCNLSALVL